MDTVLITDLFSAKQRDHRDEISRNADQHEENATGGGEVQQPPWVTDKENHRSWILQHLDRHVAAAIAPGLVARHPPVLQHLRKAELTPFVRLRMPCVSAVGRTVRFAFRYFREMMPVFPAENI